MPLKFAWNGSRVVRKVCNPPTAEAQPTPYWLAQTIRCIHATSARSKL